jgi:hypothetical protein
MKQLLKCSWRAIDKAMSIVIWLNDSIMLYICVNDGVISGQRGGVKPGHLRRWRLKQRDGGGKGVVTSGFQFRNSLGAARKSFAPIRLSLSASDPQQPRQF